MLNGEWEISDFSICNSLVFLDNNVLKLKFIVKV